MDIIVKVLIGTSGIFNFILGLVVLKKKNIRSNLYFVLFAFFTATLNLANLFLLINPTLFKLRFTYALGSLVIASSFGWVVYFTRNNSKLIYFSYTLGLVSFGLSLSPLIVKEVLEFSSTGQQIQYGLLYNYFSLYLFVTLIAGLILLFMALNNPAINKNQTKFILLGILSFGFLTLFFVTILPLFKITSLMNLDSTSALFFVAFSAYAIVKHRLMDIRILVLKSVAYSLTILIIATAYVSVFYLGIERLNQLKLFNPLFLNVSILLLLAYTFTPIKNFIARHTDRIFAKGYYDFNELLGKMGDITKKNSRSITGLTTKVMQTLTKEMRINKAAFVLTNSPTLASVRTLGFTSKSKTLWDKPTKLAAQASEAIVYDELEEDSKEKEILRRADVQVLIPIKTEHEMEAVLALGEKKSGDMYTSQDLNLLELVAPQIALALENAKSFKEKEQRIAELKSINKMFHHIEHFLDLDNLLQEIADEAIKVTGAEGGSLMLLNKGGKTLSIKTARNLHPLISLNTKIKVGEGLAGTVAKTHEPLILNGLRDKKFRPYLKREDIVSAISVPMKAGDKLVGVLNVNRKKLRVEFSEENLNVMTAFASQAAEAIVKAGYYHKIEKLSVKNDNQFKEFTKALAKTVDAKDPYTYGHSEAVTGYALEIAQEMGLSEAQLRVIEIGGRLHDMGKIGISERILNKPGSLTDEEFTAIKRHPEIGADILKDTHYLKGIKELILYHHERFDGHGYPTGLKGKDIPLGARILAVADTYDAMTSHRAYRPALSQKIAVAEIVKCSGSQFDSDIAKVFLKILDRKKLRVIKNTTHQATYIAEAKAKRLDKKAE